MPGMAANRAPAPRCRCAAERLAAGEPNLVYAKPHDNAYKPLDLFEAKQLMPRLELDVLRRHAIETAQVAPIGDTDAQVRMHSTERVHQRFGPRRRNRKMHRLLGGVGGRCLHRVLTYSSLTAAGALFRQSGMDPECRCRRPSFRASKSARSVSAYRLTTCLPRRPRRDAALDGHGNAGLANFETFPGGGPPGAARHTPIGPGLRIQAARALFPPSHYTTGNRATQSADRRNCLAWYQEIAPRPQPPERPLRPGRQTDRFARSRFGSSPVADCRVRHGRRCRSGGIGFRRANRSIDRFLWRRARQ